MASYVRASALQHFSTRSSVAANYRFPANGAENTAYLGWPLIIGIGLVGTWGVWRQNRFILWWLLSAGSLAVLALGTPDSVNGHDVGHGPWALVWRIPPLGGSQPVRLSLLITLMIAGLLAWPVAQQQGRWRVAATATVCALVLMPLWPAHRYRAQQLPPTPAFFISAAVAELPAGATTVVLPQAAYLWVAAMVHQIRSNLRFDLVGGYSIFELNGRSTSSPPLPAFVEVLADAGRRGTTPAPTRLAAVRGSVRTSGVRYILITPDEPHAGSWLAPLPGSPAASYAPPAGSSSVLSRDDR